MDRIVDPDDFCRSCKGKGYIRFPEERDGRMRDVFETCFFCDGTGLRSVIIDRKVVHDD